MARRGAPDGTDTSNGSLWMWVLRTLSVARSWKEMLSGMSSVRSMYSPRMILSLIRCGTLGRALERGASGDTRSTVGMCDRPASDREGPARACADAGPGSLAGGSGQEKGAADEVTEVVVACWLPDPLSPWWMDATCACSAVSWLRTLARSGDEVWPWCALSEPRTVGTLYVFAGDEIEVAGGDGSDGGWGVAPDWCVWESSRRAMRSGFLPVAGRWRWSQSKRRTATGLLWSDSGVKVAPSGVRPGSRLERRRPRGMAIVRFARRMENREWHWNWRP